MNLYDVVNDLFIYLTTFRWRIDAGVNLSLDRVQKDLQQIFHVQEVKIRQNPSLASGYNQVKYALVVFADEVILNSDWMNAVEWERDLLELRFFETDVGGDRFFDLCEDLEMDDPEVAAIFYNCLALGFRGRYDADAEELRQTKQDLLEKCTPVTEAVDDKLAPQAYTVARGRKFTKLPMILKWHHVIFIIILLVGVYVVLDRFIIWHHYTATINHVRNYAAARLNMGPMSSPTAPAEVLAEPIDEPPPADDSFSQLADDQILASANVKISGGDAGGEYPDSMPKVEKPISDAEPAAVSSDVNEDVWEQNDRTVATNDDDTSDAERPLETETNNASGYTIQISTGFSKKASEALIEKYQAKGYEPFLVEYKRRDGKTVWLVRMGHYNVGEIDQAREAAAEFARKEKVNVFVTNIYNAKDN